VKSKQVFALVAVLGTFIAPVFLPALLSSLFSTVLSPLLSPFSSPFEEPIPTIHWQTGQAVAAGKSKADKGDADHDSGGKKGSSDPHKRLKEIEKDRKQMHEKLQQARKAEKKALAHLHEIKSNLRATENKLNNSQRELETTDTKIKDTEKNITVTQSQEERTSDEASQRLREIYEGQRLGLLEMAFQVKSLQALLDLFYYQERIAAADRIILHDLRARAASLVSKRDQLDEKKNVLGDMVSEFAKKAFQLNKEKSEQERTAERLRTQRAFYEQAERQLANESLALEQQIIAMVKASKGGGKDVQQGSGSMQLPLRAPVTSPFGWRRHPIFGLRKFHTGVDLAGPNRSAIVAADSGNVLYSGWYGGYGKVVIVSHGKGMATLYAHLSKAAVSPGQDVKKGQVIGYEGSTGFSTGPHLHFEVRVDGKPNNPMSYVR
jgi:murein DD-endopeptidase MepM/ murein hydrolase activator NlpD